MQSNKLRKMSAAMIPFLKQAIECSNEKDIVKVGNVELTKEEAKKVLKCLENVVKEPKDVTYNFIPAKLVFGNYFWSEIQAEINKEKSEKVRME